MIKGVIFDLDGVIVHTDKYHYLAWKKIADEESIYFDEIINNRLRGVSRMDSLNIILEKASKQYSDAEKDVLANKKNDIYKEYLKQLSKEDVSIDVLTTLNVLKAKNIKLAIGSSSKNTMMILTQIGLINYFDAIVDGTMIAKSKPDPEVFLKAASKLDLSVNECLVVEDATTGIDAAINGGFKGVGINDAKFYSKTTFPIDKVSEVIELL